MPRSSIDVEHDGFYLLKKDSQRRLTLSRVLEQDSEKICSKWMLSIQQDFGNTVLTMNHLETLRCALKEYIMDQNRNVIEQAMTTLKEELDFDSNAINELHSAIYMFQEAVNVVLRMHSIKPHWMFALDNLVRNAVQAAITVLSPELGANLAGQEGRRAGGVAAGGPDVGTPSALSTATSTHQIRHENHKLQQELIESYQQHQALLRQMLEEQKLQTQIIRELVESRNRSEPDELEPPEPEEVERVRQWVSSRGLPAAVARALSRQHYTLTDLLLHAQREDVSRLHLSGGIELRLWRAIQEHRLHAGPTHLRRSSSTETDIDTNSIVVVECQRCKSIRRTTSTNSNCSSNPTVVIREHQVNGESPLTQLYGENGVDNL